MTAKETVIEVDEIDYNIIIFIYTLTVSNQHSEKLPVTSHHVNAVQLKTDVYTRRARFLIITLMTVPYTVWVDLAIIIMVITRAEIIWQKTTSLGS